MIRFQILSLIILMFLNGSGQNPHLATHRFTDHAGIIAKHKNGFCFVSTSSDRTFQTITRLALVNPEGRLSHVLDYMHHEVTNIQSMCTTSDGKIVFVSVSHGCDYSTGTDPVYLTKIDTIGNILFDTIIATTSSSWSIKLQVEEASDGTFFVAAGSLGLLHVAKNGTWKKILPLFGAINRFLLLDSGRVLFSDTYGLQITDTVNYPIVQTNAGLADRLFRTSTGSYFAMIQGKIFKYNDSLIALDSLMLPSGVTLSDLDCKNDTLYLAANSGTSCIIFLADTNLNMITQFQPATAYLKPVSISGLPGKKAVISFDQASTEFWGACSAHMVITDPNLQFNYNRDLAVESATLHNGFFQNGGGGKIVRMNWRVTVKNVGNVPITSFFLNCSYNSPAICGSDYFHKLYYNTNLSPQSSMTLETGYFDTYMGNGFSGTFPSTFTLNNVCFFTTLPDMQIDKDPVNDAWCSGIMSLDVVTGLKENNSGDKKIEIFPNPFSENLTIVTGENFDWELQDATGRFILSGRAEGQVLEHWDIQPGIYLLIVKMKNGTAQKKLIRN